MQESLTQPFQLGVGLGVSSSNADEPFLAATASKKISLLEGEHTQLSAKARVEVDPRSSKVSELQQGDRVLQCRHMPKPPGSNSAGVLALTASSIVLLHTAYQLQLVCV